jgi:hypothetical protein
VSLNEQVPPPGQPEYGQQQPQYGQPQSGQPEYGGQPQYPNFQAQPPAPQQQGTSVLAIVGFILAFVAPLIGFILSFIAIFKVRARPRVAAWRSPARSWVVSSPSSSW